MLMLLPLQIPMAICCYSCGLHKGYVQHCHDGMARAAAGRTHGTWLLLKVLSAQLINHQMSPCKYCHLQTTADLATLCRSSAGGNNPGNITPVAVTRPATQHKLGNQHMFDTENSNMFFTSCNCSQRYGQLCTHNACQTCHIQLRTYDLSLSR
jgi:hypothetical protein